MTRYHRHSSVFRITATAMTVLLALLGMARSAHAFTFVSQARLGNRSVTSPSVTAANGTIYLAFLGTDSHRRINVARSTDGMNFTQTVQLGGNTSPFAPAIAFFNGQVYVAFTGADPNGSINLVWGDGTNFPNQVVLPNTNAFSGPGLGVANGKLYLAWLGREAPNKLHITSSSFPNSFPAQTVIDFSSSNTALQGLRGSPAVLGIHDPQLLGVGDLVVIAFTFADGKVQLLTDQGSFGTFSGHTFTQISTSSGSGLWFDGSRMLLAALDAGSGLTLSASSLGSGGSIFLAPQETLANNNRSFATPAVVAFNGRLFYYWTGDNSDQNLNVMQLVP